MDHSTLWVNDEFFKYKISDDKNRHQPHFLIDIALNIYQYSQ